MRDRFSRLLSAASGFVRILNARLLPGTAVLCIVSLAAERAGAAELLSGRNLVVLVLLQASLFAFSEPETTRRAARFLESVFVHYLVFVRRFARAGLSAFALLVFAGLVALPPERLPALFGPVLAIFAFSAVLAAFEPADRPGFFRRVAVSRSLFAACALAGAFVGAYAYRAVFGRYDLPAPILSSVALGLLFCLAVVAFGSDAGSAFVRWKLDRGHMAARRIRVLVVWASIAAASASFAIFAVIALAWRAEILSREVAAPASRAADEFAAELADIFKELDSLPVSSVASGASGSGTASSSAGAVPTGSGAAEGGSGTATSSGVAGAPAEDPKPAMRPIREIIALPRYIGLGNTGEDVRAVQRLLAREGYYSGSLNAVFDEATSAALAKFIRARARVNYDYTQLGPKAMEIFKGIEIGLP